MCPIRPFEKNGQWGTKQHRIYELDEEGNRIRDEDGNYVFNAVPTTDWGNPETLEHWRQAWADLCNAMFEEKELVCRIDNRSYERQGLDILPTVHEGPAVRQMEAQGIRTNKGDLNRWIKATNDLLRSVKKKLADLLDWLKEAKEVLDKPQSPALAQILGEYYAIRNAGAYSNKAKIGNTKRYSEDFTFLESKGLRTVEDLESYVSGLSGKLFDLNESMRKKAKGMKALNDLIRQAEDYTRLKPIVDAIPPKGGWGKKHKKYMAEHDSEIRQFYAVKQKLDNSDIPNKKLTPEKWQKELDALKTEYDAEKTEVSKINAELKSLRNIQYKVNTYLHDHQHDRQQQQKRDMEI